MAKLIASIFWLGVLATFLVYKHTHGYSTFDILRHIYIFAAMTDYGPTIYILLYAARPVVLFPATLLTILSGGLFGLWGGILYTIIGENLSASIAYFLGKMIGSGVVDDEKIGFLGEWRKKLEENSFISVLIMRFTYLPFDLVNYACGALRINWTAFTIATFIGILPGMVTFVSFGASVNIEEFVMSIEDFDFSGLFDTKQLIISGALFVVSLVIAKLVHRRHTVA